VFAIKVGKVCSLSATAFTDQQASKNVVHIKYTTEPSNTTQGRCIRG